LSAKNVVLLRASYLASAICNWSDCYRCNQWRCACINCNKTWN
jgi:hypothetical protein